MKALRLIAGWFLAAAWCVVMVVVPAYALELVVAFMLAEGVTLNPWDWHLAQRIVVAGWGLVVFAALCLATVDAIMGEL